jgi:hypothetical protein
MALASGALEAYVRALKTCELSCIGRPARSFFILKAHGQLGTVGHVAAPEPSPVERRDPEP